MHRIIGLALFAILVRVEPIRADWVFSLRPAKEYRCLLSFEETGTPPEFRGYLSRYGGLDVPHGAVEPSWVTMKVGDTVELHLWNGTRHLAPLQSYPVCGRSEYRTSERFRLQLRELGASRIVSPESASMPQVQLQLDIEPRLSDLVPPATELPLLQIQGDAGYAGYADPSFGLNVFNTSPIQLREKSRLHETATFVLERDINDEPLWLLRVTVLEAIEPKETTSPLLIPPAPLLRNGDLIALFPCLFASFR